MRKAMLLLAAFGLAGALWAADPFVGTWELNLAKSYVTNPNAMPKSETGNTVAIDNGLKTTFDGVGAEGRAYRIERTIIFDGKDHPLKGDLFADTVSADRINANTFYVVTKKSGEEVSKWRVTLSKNGKTQTLTGFGKSPRGHSYRSTFIYDKQ